LWKDCPQDALTRDGTGYFIHADFLGAPLVTSTITSALLGRLSVAPGFSIDGDDDTVITMKTAELGGYIDLETDGDDNDAVAIFTEPFGRVEIGSGKKLWLEARFEIGAVADQGLFFGLVEDAGASRDVVADNAGALIGESLIGFQILADDTNGVDAVFKLNAGTAVEMRSDITNLNTPAALTAFAVAADTEFKLGLKFDGDESIELYVNGVKVFVYTITPATFPVNVNMGAIFALKTGSAAAQSVAIDWIRGAYQAD